MTESLGQELTNFCLAGHSFGGFLAANYALKHPNHVKKLLLISPIGIYVPTREDMANPIG